MAKYPIICASRSLPRNTEPGLNFNRGLRAILKIALQRPEPVSLRSLLAAHKAANPAGESPAMVNNDEPFSHNQRGLLG